MSGFKRMQSRVFWSQMAARDAIETRPLIGAMSAASSIASLPNACTNLGMPGERNSDSSLRDSDASDANVTAVRANEPSDLSVESIERKRIRDQSPRDDREKSRSRDSGGNVSNARQITSDSPSLCNRSLDSGFSDSERSNGPDSRDDGSPNDPRRRQRRRRRRRGRSRSRRRTIRGSSERELALTIHRRLVVGSLWKDGEEPPDPAHTSTPRAEKYSDDRGAIFAGMQPQRVTSRIAEDKTRRERRSEQEEENCEIPVLESGRTEDECLGDFLYAAEPPEDEDVRAISNRSPFPASRIVERDSRRRDSFEKRCYADPRHTAVRAWLGRLVAQTEDECCVTLRSKALPKGRTYREASERRHPRRRRCCDETQTPRSKIHTASATAAATELLVRADDFTRHLTKIIEKLSSTSNGRSERELIRSAEDEAFSVLSELGEPVPRRIQPGDPRGASSRLENLRTVVDAAIDERLDSYIERVVGALEEGPREGGNATRGALAALTALGLAGNRAANSVARCSGIRVLLSRLASSVGTSSDARASTLRALASVCCCPSAIEQFVAEDGPGVLLDLLEAEESPETEKTEATALIVQITAPWSNALGLAHLEPRAAPLVASLTRLAERTNCGQTLLLVAAAFNNLADSASFVEPILREDTTRKLLKRVRKLSGASVWLMEQVASLIAKLAKIPRARSYLARARASVALLCFLRMGTPGLEGAYERLEMTAAEALARLCLEPEIARQVVAVGGVDCLPFVARTPPERDPRRTPSATNR